ncbi:HAD-IA family hydrolase [Salinarimonas soli]|uniref:HAD-IA family hydrolase n=1 Tax=Salinarimonas soli TaxID=1638099 RepID=A0A5B2V6Z3_9HYPH|nr:HAD-IA family hydrolase [Salinarimonas soli]KAA2234606.1 HAD-IA family hydrolase [Salinarimonas soli]
MPLILFDVDGTLVDSQDMIAAAHGRAFASLGLPCPERGRLLELVGLSLPETFTALVGPDGPVAPLEQAYRDAFKSLRADPARAEPLFPGADAALRRLSGTPGVRLGIATGKSRRGVAALLERFGWVGLFATVQTADDAPSKPHPGMIERALAEISVPPASAVMIGDSIYDMAMARAAGTRALGVAWGYHTPERLRASGAEAVAGSFDEVLAWLAGEGLLAP